MDSTNSNTKEGAHLERGQEEIILSKRSFGIGVEKYYQNIFHEIHKECETGEGIPNSFIPQLFQYF